MPALKTTKEEERKNSLRGYILKNMQECRLNENQLAAKLHIAKRTFKDKFDDPRRFKYDELLKLFYVLKFSSDEILKCVRLSNFDNNKD